MKEREKEYQNQISGLNAVGVDLVFDLLAAHRFRIKNRISATKCESNGSHSISIELAFILGSSAWPRASARCCSVTATSWGVSSSERGHANQCWIGVASVFELQHRVRRRLTEETSRLQGEIQQRETRIREFVWCECIPHRAEAKNHQLEVTLNQLRSTQASTEGECTRLRVSLEEFSCVSESILGRRERTYLFRRRLLRVKHGLKSVRSDLLNSRHLNNRFKIRMLLLKSCVSFWISLKQMRLIVCKKWLRSETPICWLWIVKNGRVNVNLQRMNNRSKPCEVISIKCLVENNNGLLQFGVEYGWCREIIEDGICTEWTTNIDAIISANFACKTW